MQDAGPRVGILWDGAWNAIVEAGTSRRTASDNPQYFVMLNRWLLDLSVVKTTRYLPWVLLRAFLLLGIAELRSQIDPFASTTKEGLETLVTMGGGEENFNCHSTPLQFLRTNLNKVFV
jgi:hypothetical protein